MLDFIGGLIGSGTKLLGGIFGNESTEKVAQENIANQDMLARNRIQMTVADAKAAGINPLAALGNATQSYSNVVGSTSLGDSIGDAGQSLGRAVAAMAPAKLRNQELENKLLEAKIANLNNDTVTQQKNASDQVKSLGQPGTGPGVPLPRPNTMRPGFSMDKYLAPALMQQMVDPRTGELVWVPSDKAASPLQTLAATPVNAALAGHEITNLEVPPEWSHITGAVKRAVSDFNSAIYDRNTTGY